MMIEALPHTFHFFHGIKSLLTYSLKILFYLSIFVFLFPMASSSYSVAAFPSVSQAVHIKLDRNNYPLWLAQILPLLKSRNLMSFVNSDAVAPSPFLKDDKGKLTLKRLDQLQCNKLLVKA